MRQTRTADDRVVLFWLQFGSYDRTAVQIFLICVSQTFIKLFLLIGQYDSHLKLWSLMHKLNIFLNKKGIGSMLIYRLVD
jgi:hypothetical protein